MITPASAGPTARAKLNSMPFSAEAAARSSFEMISGRTARHVGVSIASPADSANVRPSSSHRRHESGDRRHGEHDRDGDHPELGVEDQPCDDRRCRRCAPAGSAKTKNGRADAVWVRATYIGPAPSDTISHAAPTDLHERAHVRHDVGEQQIAKERRTQGSPETRCAAGHISSYSRSRIARGSLGVKSKANSHARMTLKHWHISSSSRFKACGPPCASSPIANRLSRWPASPWPCSTDAAQAIAIGH